MKKLVGTGERLDTIVSFLSIVLHFHFFFQFKSHGDDKLNNVTNLKGASLSKILSDIWTKNDKISTFS